VFARVLEPASPPPAGVALTVPGELYLLLHDQDGCPVSRGPATGLVLAAGVLSELILAGAVSVGSAAVVARTPARPVGPVEAAVHGQIMTEPPYPLGTWLSFLRHEVAERVALHLHEVGCLHCVTWRCRRRAHRPTPGRRGCCVPVGSAERDRVGARLAAILTPQRHPPPVSVRDAVLLGLLHSVGLMRTLLEAEGTGPVDTVAGLVGRLGPLLRDLVVLTGSTLGGMVLTHRG
jgi:hypothetical protein